MRKIRHILRDLKAYNGRECPECGERGPEWNGHSGAHAGYLCTACGHQWEAWQYEPTDEELENAREASAF